tara:strand:- start:239 stop:2602 length:2364 start_codon:yes stop_codon:yes gene_type:complete
MAGFTEEDLRALDAESGDAEANQTGDINVDQIDKKEERSLFERIKAAPKAISDAITGEGQDIEFPDVPETSTMGSDEGPSFWEGLVPNLKIMAVRDDFGKTEIMESSFKDDPRWGGAFVDKFGLPMIMWNEKPYYVNKPGASSQDLGTAIGEITKFFPATKIANAGKTIWSVLRRGALGYSATEGASKALETKLAPEVAGAKKTSGEVTPTSIRDDIALSTAIGVGADVALPPAAKLAKRAIVGGAKAVTPAAVKNLFPRITPEIINDSRFIMSQGQRTSPAYDPNASAIKQSQASEQITQEDILRGSKLEGGGGPTIREFDANQLDQIRQEATMLRDQFGSGKVGSLDSDLVPYESATGVQNIVTGEADKLKGTATSGYKAVREAVDQPIVTPKGMNETTTRALQTVADLQLSARELADFPQLAREIKYLQKLQKMSANPRFKGSPFKLISGYQKTINRLMRDAATDTEKKAFGQIKSVIDDSVFNGIEQGFITGNKEVIDTLFASKEAYRKYIGLTGKAAKKDDNAANNILKMITNPDYDPKSFVNSLFGHSKFNPSKEMTKVLKNYKANLPQEKYDEVIALIKDGVIEKAFSGAGRSGVTRANIVNNYKDVFLKNKNLIDELFTPDEVARIADFRKNVIPTMWADPSLMLNASGTSYSLLSAGRMAGILSSVAKVPVVAAVTGAEGAASQMSRSASMNDALNAISQYTIRSNKPLLSVGGRVPFTNKRVDVDVLIPADASRAGQTVVREPVVEEDDVETSPAVLGILDSIDASTREKIMATQPR